ncbi:cation diffusion facilitator family transporter, partial [Acinetobacter pittii]
MGLNIMQDHSVSRHHQHQFDEGNPLAQKRILIATILTASMMVLEIFGGWFFNSMALLADGWHMSSHMLALGLAYFAYRAARHYSKDRRFSFGTWKIEILAGYSSAILLMVVAIFMAFQSIQRLFNPVEIFYNEAIPIAILGLVINLICAWLLHDDG